MNMAYCGKNIHLFTCAKFRFFEWKTRKLQTAEASVIKIDSMFMRVTYRVAILWELRVSQNLITNTLNFNVCGRIIDKFRKIFM